MLYRTSIMKYISFVMVLSIIFSLTACSRESSSQTDTEQHKKVVAESSIDENIIDEEL